MMTFLDFINERRKNAENLQIFNEAFKNSDVEKANKLITDLFKKHIDGGKVMFDKVPYSTLVDGKKCKTVGWYLFKGNKVEMYWTFNYLVSAKSTEVYSIDFYNETQYYELMLKPEGTKTSLSIYTMGSSVVYFLPIIYHVVNEKDFSLSEKTAKDLSQKIFKESVKESEFYVGALKYNIYEGVSNTLIRDTFDININEGVEPAVRDLQRKKRDERNDLYRKKVQTKDPKDIEKHRQLEAEVRAINAAIAGGATTLKEIELAIKSVKVQLDIPGVDKVDLEKNILDEFNKEEEPHKEPLQVWKEMQKYIKMVIKGLQPSLIICGAPGIGKTYKVIKQLKAAGYEDGKNLNIIKAKASPRALYAAMYDYQKKGDILLIDDADCLVGPKAPEDCINLLKAALDSTSADKGKKVNYNVQGKIYDDEGIELPHSFYYNGGVIILTNYSAGQLDSALRGRSFVQDIRFTVKDILSEIKRLMPEIEPEMWSMKSKTKAYNYLVELSEDPKHKNMQLSLRVFGLCAKIYENAEGDDDFTDEDCESMIKEQMKMQAMSGGKKY